MTSLSHLEGYMAEINTVEHIEIVQPPHLTLVEVEPDICPPPKTDAPKPTFEYIDDWRRAVAARTDPDAFEVLHKEYAELIRYKASRYFLQGGEAEDLIQEGMFGLYKGVRDYDGQRSSLRNFVDLCVSRQIITAVKTASRNKHSPLNQALSFSSSPNRGGDETDPDLTLEGLLADRSPLPDAIVTGREAFTDLSNMITSKLSYLECTVLGLFMDGDTYEAIAEKLDVNTKTVDNALQRVKRKVGQYLRKSDEPDAESSVHETTIPNELGQERDQLEWLYESWLKHVYSPAEKNLCRTIAELKGPTEAQSAIIREVRGYLALIALDSNWASPLKAFNKARSAVIQRAMELSKREQSSEIYVTDTLINAALEAVKKP